MTEKDRDNGKKWEMEMKKEMKKEVEVRCTVERSKS